MSIFESRQRSAQPWTKPRCYSCNKGMFRFEGHSLIFKMNPITNPSWPYSHIILRGWSVRGWSWVRKSLPKGPFSLPDLVLPDEWLPQGKIMNDFVFMTAGQTAAERIKVFSSDAHWLNALAQVHDTWMVFWFGAINVPAAICDSWLLGWKCNHLCACFHSNENILYFFQRKHENILYRTE